MSKRKDTAKDVEPYGYDVNAYPTGQRYRRPDGYDPYREKDGPKHPHSAPIRDGREHPTAEYSRYGDNAGDPNAPARTSLPDHLKQETGKDTRSR